MFIFIIIMIGPEPWCWETISPLYNDAKVQTFCYEFVKYIFTLGLCSEASLSPPCFLNNDLTKTENRKLIITK